MSCYRHLSMQERESLLVRVTQGKSLKEISKEMGRSKSTIWRELKRNVDSAGNYSASEAQERYRERRRKSVRRRKLEQAGYAEKMVELLNQYWSPEQISGRLKHEKSAIQISTSTIYRGLEKGLIDPMCRQRLRIKGRRRYGGHKKSKCGHLDIEYTIHDRPKRADARKQIGHWESDTVRGAKWSGCIGTHVERRSRYVVLCKLPDRTARAYTDAMIAAFAQLAPGKRKSFTADHGKEFAGHREIARALQCNVYFADPSAPWQRGTNENTNGLLRQFCPKRTSFHHLTQEDVDRIADLLNKRPRKCLHWKSPYEVFFHCSFHFT